MRDPELVARAQHAAVRLEAAWERWRAAQGLADTPGQPVVSYVGYALKEPWGQPRAVIGFSADEAERLADYLEHGASAGPQSMQASARQPAGQPVPTSQAEPARPPQPGGQEQQAHDGDNSTSLAVHTGASPHMPTPADQPTLLDLAAERSLSAPVSHWFPG